MDFQSEISALLTEIGNKISLTKALAANLKRQSRRMSSTTSRYKSQQKSDGIFSKIPLKDPNFKDLEEYSELLLKQFSVRFEELVKQHQGTKISIETLAHEIKNNPKENYTTRIEALRNILEKFQTDFQLIWSQEHLLALNYRLDISAKELQRWTMVMEAHNTKPEAISAVVDNFFK